MKKILFFTALLAFLAGSGYAVTTLAQQSSEISIQDTNSKDGDNKDNKKEADTKATTSETTKTKGCSSEKACCKKDSKACCSGDKKKKKDN
jgi:hypothetical protein